MQRRQFDLREWREGDSFRRASGGGGRRPNFDLPLLAGDSVEPTPGSGAPSRGGTPSLTRRASDPEGESQFFGKPDFREPQGKTRKHGVTVHLRRVDGAFNFAIRPVDVYATGRGIDQPTKPSAIFNILCH